MTIEELRIAVTAGIPIEYKVLSGELIAAE